MPAWNPNDYETVDDRLHKFWDAHPSGRIETELVAYSDTQFIVKAYAYRDTNDEVPTATGYAEERVGSSPVNKTSALENAETSAVGRALANMGLSPKGARPSREEMGKAERVKKELMPDELAARYAHMMTEAATMETLDACAADAKRYEMTDKQRDQLRAVYLDMKKELLAVTA